MIVTQEVVWYEDRKRERERDKDKEGKERESKREQISLY